MSDSNVRDLRAPRIRRAVGLSTSTALSGRTGCRSRCRQPSSCGWGEFWPSQEPRNLSVKSAYYGGRADHLHKSSTLIMKSTISCSSSGSRSYTHTRIRVILASLRLCGHGSQTMFSGRPPPGQSPLDWYSGMFHMTVGRKVGLLFPCDVPHGQGRIPPDEDTWSFFATLHHQDTSPDGLDNSTLNHSTYIHRALTRPGESWEPRGVRYLLANPRILQQV